MVNGSDKKDLVSESNARTKDIICHTTLWAVFKYSDYGSHTYYEVWTECYSVGGSGIDYSGGRDNSGSIGGGGGTSSGGTGNGPADFTFAPGWSEAEIMNLLAGDIPIEEFEDKCEGVQHMWNNYPNNETMGYITRDGSLLMTNVAGVSGGQVSGAYEYEDGTTYYTWPISQGPPAKQYEGIIRRAGYYLVPVVASVHTHTPCRRDGTDGVSHPVGNNDTRAAYAYPNINHWVVGCGVVAQYDHINNNFFNKRYGNLSVTCAFIN